MRVTPRIRARLALLLALASVLPAAAPADDAPAQDSRRKQEIIAGEIPEHSATDAPFDVSAKSTASSDGNFYVESGEPGTAQFSTGATMLSGKVVVAEPVVLILQLGVDYGQDLNLIGVRRDRIPEFLDFGGVVAA